ncbi:MAG: deoxyribose-phosphate aldolase [Deltaproteobacteria bacterium]|nr:deoxyribose-phosphate aldolase [Deltaproteobacteria bacterium]
MARGPLPPGTLRSPRDLAPLIDHTLLRPGATGAEVERLCREALQHAFAGVCVRLEHVALVAARLSGSAVLPVAVVDFPLGQGGTPARADEARAARDAGAREVDVVLPLPAFRALRHREVVADLAAVVAAAGQAEVKVILETAALSPAERAMAAALAVAAGAAWVKTSTGFGPGGATAEDVALLRACVGPAVGVKASGGIRTAADARRMAEAGASRIGCSASVAIVEAATF